MPSATVTGVFDLARSSSLTIKKDLCILIRHQVSGAAASNVPLFSSSRCLRRFWCLHTEMIHPKKRSAAYLQGFPQNGQNLEHLERFGPETKTVFEGVSLQRGVKNDPPSNTSNGLGNSKGLREGRGVRGGGGLWQGLRLQGNKTNTPVSTRTTHLQKHSFPYHAQASPTLCIE